MKATAQIAFLLSWWIAITASRAQEASPRGPDGSARLSLTNQAVVVLARLRGVAESEVKIQPRSAGVFEVDLSGAKDWEKEAVELSKAFGAAATVIVDHASGDGLMRTNWTFTAGRVDKRIAPVGKTGLTANGRRMHVWPRPAAPGRIRVREQAE